MKKISGLSNKVKECVPVSYTEWCVDSDQQNAEDDCTKEERPLFTFQVIETYAMLILIRNVSNVFNPHRGFSELLKQTRMEK